MTVIQQPHIQEVLGGRLAASRLGVLAMLSAVVGAMFAWLAGALQPASVFQSIEQVQEQLPVTVLGAVALPAGPISAERNPVFSRSLGWLLTGCEVILALVLLLTIGAALADGAFRGLVASDPLDAVATALGHLVGRP